MISSNSYDARLKSLTLLIRSRAGVKIIYHHDVDAEQQDVPVDAHRNESSGQSEEEVNEAETILGFNIDVLTRLLTPNEWQAQQRFEISIDDLTFIGCPVFSNNDGSWQEGDAGLETVSAEAVQIKDHAMTRIKQEASNLSTSLGSELSGNSLAASFDSVSTRGSDKAVFGMTMFHIVFALTPKSDPGDRSLAAELYENVAATITKALRHLQAQYQYLEKQCRQILLNRQKQAQLVRDAHLAGIEQSKTELQFALQELAHAISRDKVANIRLNGISMSFQLPSPDYKKLDSSALNQALLLLEDKTSLLQDLETQPSSTALSFFITHSVPTKSLGKLAVKLNLPAPAILFLAEHLIKYRKARLIPPLHSRNMYVIAEDAPLEQLPELMGAYGRKFPALPSLVKMMDMLGSGKAMQYGSCFPSRAHRDVYMDILAWMVRMKIVKRLNTAGWLCFHVDELSEVQNEDESHEENTSNDADIAEMSSATAGRVKSSLILHPNNLTQQEERAILALQQSLPESLRLTMRMLVKHFNGEKCLEDIAIVEGLKRSQVEGCLAELEKKGVLKTFYHA